MLHRVTSSVEFVWPEWLPSCSSIKKRSTGQCMGTGVFIFKWGVKSCLLHLRNWGVTPWKCPFQEQLQKTVPWISNIISIFWGNTDQKCTLRKRLGGVGLVSGRKVTNFHWTFDKNRKIDHCLGVVVEYYFPSLNECPSMSENKKWYYPLCQHLLCVVKYLLYHIP